MSSSTLRAIRRPLLIWKLVQRVSGDRCHEGDADLPFMSGSAVVL